MPSLIQPSFARGEIGPDLYGRVDVSAYPVALRKALNMVIHAYGGASNRTGLMFVAPCSTHTGTPPALIEFKYSTTDTYILEFGDFYMRVIRDDSQVLNSIQNITAVTSASPGVVTVSTHGYSTGEDIYIYSVSGMTQINNRWFTVGATTTNTFELTDQQTGANVSTTGYDAYTSGGLVSSVYEISTPYSIEDVVDIVKAQSANVMTLTHVTYPPYELTRTDHDAWTLSEITFEPAHLRPVGLQVTATTTGAETYRYRVTAINSESQEESLPGVNANNKAISGATKADPCVLTVTGHGYANGDEIEVNNIVGMTELNGRRFFIANQTTNTIELEGEDSSGYTTYSSAGEIRLTFDEITNGADPIDNAISWTARAGTDKYSVYRLDNGIYGWLGDTENTSFVDDDIVPDLSITPPKARNPFFGAGNYPGAVSFFQQRRVFGGTTNDPDTTFYSVTGSRSNMSQSSPRQADDAITATLNSLEVNQIQGFVPVNDLLVFTSGSEWKVNSGDEVAFSAENLRQKPQSTWGSSKIQPIQIGEKILYITEGNRYVRSLGYELTAADGYKGNDMTVFAPHLFRNCNALDWSFSRWPDPLVAVCKTDGLVAALTYNPEQEVVAWARWETEGKFLRTAAVRPNATSADSAHYFVVQRTIQGESAYYIERTKDRRFLDVRDCFFVDSGLSLDSPVDITGVSLADPAVVTAAAHGFSVGDEIDISDIKWVANVSDTYTKTQPDQINDGRYFIADVLTNSFALVNKERNVNQDITAATQADPCVLTVVGHGFEFGDKVGIFDVVGMTELNGVTYQVGAVTTDTLELTNTDSTGFTAYISGGSVYHCVDATEFNAYVENGSARQAVSTLGNLWHLEGEEVVILADGDVVSGTTVSSGQVTLTRKASRVHVGLRYIADLQSLDPEAKPSGGTLQGRKTRVTKVTIRMKESRGLLAGPDETHLTEMHQREFENYGEPTALLTGDKTIEITSDWSSGGRVYLRQINPLP